MDQEDGEHAENNLDEEENRLGDTTKKKMTYEPSTLQVYFTVNNI